MSMLNWFDWFFITVVFIFAVFGFLQGFIRGLISLLTWCFAVIFAYFFASIVSVNFIAQWFFYQEIAFWLSFLLIIILVWVLGSIACIIFSFFYPQNRSRGNRFWGFSFGVIKSVLVLSVIIGICSHNKILIEKNFWKQSLLVPFLVKGSLWINHDFSDNISQKFHDKLTRS